MRTAPRRGERTPLACCFRRLAENFVPLTFCAGRKVRTGTRWFGRAAQTSTRVACAPHSHFGVRAHSSMEGPSNKWRGGKFLRSAAVSETGRSSRAMSRNNAVGGAPRFTRLTVEPAPAVKSISDSWLPCLCFHQACAKHAEVSWRRSYGMVPDARGVETFCERSCRPRAAATALSHARDTPTGP